MKKTTIVAKVNEPMRPQDMLDILKRLGITQTEFAEIIDYSQRSVNNWMTNRLNTPQIIALLLTLAERHGLTGDDIRRAAGIA
jgi:DNA-binding transcriptional regulator YiaG